MEFPEFPDMTLLAAPFFVLAVTLEWWAVKTNHAHGRYEVKDAFSSMSMGLGNAIIGVLTGGVAFAMLYAFWPYRIITLDSNWWTIALAFVAYDLTYYWKHRFAHRMRWFWMEHVTHHSSQHYNLTTALRQPWFGPFTGLILLGVPMVLLGVHPNIIALVAGLNLVYQFWIHTEMIDRMPRWFEAVFNTPSHHRVHHATNPRYLDANYAGVFIVWDKMFGTFVPELSETEPPNYGIVHNLKTHNPIVIAYHEFVALMRDCARDGLRPDRWLRRAVNPPGWSPTGKLERSEEIKSEWLSAHPEEADQPGLPAKLLTIQSQHSQ